MWRASLKARSPDKIEVMKKWLKSDFSGWPQSDKQVTQKMLGGQKVTQKSLNGD